MLPFEIQNANIRMPGTGSRQKKPMEFPPPNPAPELIPIVVPYPGAPNAAVTMQPSPRFGANAAVLREFEAEHFNPTRVMGHYAHGHHSGGQSGYNCIKKDRLYRAGEQMRDAGET